MATRVRPSKGRSTTTRHRGRGRGNELRSLRQRCALPQALLARLLGVSLRTLSGAESAAAAAPPPRMQRGMTQAVRLCDALAEAMQPRFVGQWLDTPNDMLGGLKPVEAIERGQIDLVWQLAGGLREGSQL